MATSESDIRSYEATKAVAKKAQKKFWGSNGIWTHDLRDTGAMLYQLTYDASLEAGQVRVDLLCCFGYTERLKNNNQRNVIAFSHLLWKQVSEGVDTHASDLVIRQTLHQKCSFSTKDCH